jgi:hypothetical protein
MSVSGLNRIKVGGRQFLPGESGENGPERLKAHSGGLLLAGRRQETE